ncbi:MAG TPA: MaoC family dehydratase [Acidimicrobiales bacterium]|nr:MaoC family dehydratase [Acidimicrobiales bacterium]
MEPESVSCAHGPVTSELCVRLATLLNDFNPAHYDHGFATGVGLPGVIGPGTLLQGWVAADVAERLARRGDRGRARLGTVDLRFTSPVLVDEHIRIDYAWEGDRAAVTITAARAGADGRTVATGSLRVDREGGHAG